MNTKRNGLPLNNSTMNAIMLIILIFLTLITCAKTGLSIFRFLVVIPMIIIAMNSSYVFTIFSALLSIGIIYFISGAESIISYSLMYIVPAIITGIIFNSNLFKDRKSKSLSTMISFLQDRKIYYLDIRIMMAMIILFMAGTIGYLVTMKYGFNIDIIEGTKHTIDSAMEIYRKNMDAKTIEMLENAGVFKISNEIGTIFTVGIFAKSVFLAVLSYYVTLPLVKKLYKKEIYYINIDKIILPGRPAIFCIVAIITFWLLGYANIGINTDVILNNFILVMNILFFVEGISIVIYIFKNWRNVKTRVNWLLFIVSILFFGILPGISMIGILDNIFNYRLKWNDDDGGIYGK